MTSKLYDTIRDITRQSFEDDGAGVPHVKSVTVRPTAYTVCLADTLAEHLDMSRSALLEHVFNEGINDAVQAYFDAHGDHAKETEKAFCEAFVAKWSKQCEELNK